MRLEPVYPIAPPFQVDCLRCGKLVRVGPNHQRVYADLDGPAFRSYYCEECGDVLRTDAPQGEE